MSEVVKLVRAEAAAALSRAGVPAAAPVLCACSHGPDSLALADALAAMCPVSLVYVDHGLRPEAAEEAEGVRALAAARGVPCRVARVTVRRAGEGLEAAARAARYAALEGVAAELGIHWIALGHTASDQAETVLARLLRGSGAVGLAGIPPVRGRYVRPLLGVERATVLAYLAARGLAPSHDAMNDDRAFLRARVRHEHLPALRRENPRLDTALARAAAALRETAAALDWAADRAAALASLRAGRGEARLDAAALAALPAAVAKRLLARLAPGLEARHLEALLALARRPPAGTAGIDLPGVAARREYGDLVLGSRAPEEQAELRVAGEDGPYVVRRFLPGDRMRPAALRGRTRKLQDLFTDRKVPRAQRAHARVVVRARDEAIVWAEHVGPAFDAKIEVNLTREDPPVIYD